MRLNRLSRLEKSYAFRYPHKMYEQKLEQLDRATERLQRNSQRYFLNKKEALGQLDAILKRLHPEQTIQMSKEALKVKQKNLNRAMTAIYKQKSRICSFNSHSICR